MATNIRYLGNYESIQEVWAALPGGGQEGDYLTIDGNTFSWNKYIRQWQNSSTVVVTPTRETMTHDGDYNVGNNLRVGGDLIVIGRIINDSIKDGKSAYEIWLEQDGNEGKSVEEFLASLKESGFTSQAVQSLPTTNIDPKKIYAVPVDSDSWAEKIYSNGNWITLAIHNESGLSGVLSDVDDLKQRDEPIVFTESKVMNSFIKTLFVDKNRFEQTHGVTVNDIYASWNATSKHFYLYDAPYDGNLMLDINMSNTSIPCYCFGNNLGTFVFIEINTIQLQNSTSVASTPSASNPRPKLTSWATTRVCDPRVNNVGFTESPVLNKYINKIWIEITSNYTGSIDDVIGKLTVYNLSSIYNGETEMWTNKIIIRPQSGTNGFQYNSTSNDNEVILNRTSGSTMYNGVVIHARIDWESLRLDGDHSGIRTYLTEKAYNSFFWGTRLSDEVGNDSTIAFTQKGAKSLSTRIDRIDGQLSTIEDYTSEDLIEGYWNVGNKAVGDKMPTTPSTVASWYCVIPIPVKSGMVVTLSTKGGSNGRAWILTDTDKYILDIADAGVDTTSEPITLNVLQDGFLYVNHQAVNGTEANKAKFSLRTSLNNMASFDNEITALRNDINSLQDNSVSVAKIFNQKVDLKKAQLRVLDIGNSFTNNALGVYKDGSTYYNYITNFINAANIDVSDMCLYAAVRSSGSFKSWYDCYHDNDTVAYTISKTVGGITQPISGTAGVGDGSKFRSCLQDCTWDIILIHQASGYSTDNISTLEGNGDGGYLKELIRLIRTLQPSAAIGFLFTHVGNDDANGETEVRFAEMCKSVKQVCGNYGIDFVIPVGAALENLRASSLNTTSNGFSEDNHHLAAGLGKYVAAATYFQSLFAPRYDVSILGNAFNSAPITSDIIGTHTSYSNNFVDVTQQNAPIAQMCAILAVNDMWNINNPDGIEL